MAVTTIGNSQDQDPLNLAELEDVVAKRVCEVHANGHLDVWVRVTNMDTGISAEYQTTQSAANRLVTLYSEWRQEGQRFIVEVGAS